MGQSMDFSEGIRVIREAHSDSVAVLEKWRDLIEANGEVTLTLKMEDGTSADITLPSIREAINRYLGGMFEQIILTHGTSSVIIRMNDHGQIEMVDGADEARAANVIVGNIAASRIIGTDGILPIDGNVVILGGSIQNAAIQSLTAGTGQIRGATFSGEITISGSTQITGTLSVRHVSTATLDTGKMIYRKQVMKFKVEGRREDAAYDSNGDIFTGDVRILENAGIYSEPTWADCTYRPANFTTDKKIHIYWGETGDTKLMPPVGAVVHTPGEAVDEYAFYADYACIWPYKMYEAVDGGYRIRWLPFAAVKGRIHYVRAGNTVACIVPPRIDVIDGVVQRVAPWHIVPGYSCERFMAESESEAVAGANITHNLLYKV